MATMLIVPTCPVTRTGGGSGRVVAEVDVYSCPAVEACFATCKSEFTRRGVSTQRINLVPRHRGAPRISNRSQVARFDLLEAYLALEEDGVAARLLRAERAAEFAALCVEEQTGR